MSMGRIKHTQPWKSHVGAAQRLLILDIFSRRVVGWCIADAESATLFKPLFDDAMAKHNVISFARRSSRGEFAPRAASAGPV